MRILKEVIPYIVIVLVVVLLRTFIATPVIVSGSSMDPTLKDGQLLILNKLAHRFNRYDIVVIDVVINNKKERIVKRIIGLPGETVEYKNKKLYINGEKVRDDFSNITYDFSTAELGEKKIPKNHYLVLGDNRNDSVDSRDYRVGFINEDDIVGKPVFRLWPLNKIGIL